MDGHGACPKTTDRVAEQSRFYWAAKHEEVQWSSLPNCSVQYGTFVFASCTQGCGDTKLRRWLTSATPSYWCSGLSWHCGMLLPFWRLARLAQCHWGILTGHLADTLVEHFISFLYAIISFSGLHCKRVTWFIWILFYRHQSYSTHREIQLHQSQDVSQFLESQW